EQTARVSDDAGRPLVVDVVDPDLRAGAHERRADLGTESVAATRDERRTPAAIDFQRHAGKLDLHDDWNHHRTPSGAIGDEPREGAACVTAHGLEVGSAF